MVVELDRSVSAGTALLPVQILMQKANKTFEKLEKQRMEATEPALSTPCHFSLL